MKIALVWPFGFEIKYVMPLSMGYLKSNLDKNHDARIIDCSLNNIRGKSREFEKIIKDFNPDIVCVSCWSPTYNEATEVLKTVKRLNPNVITVMGGPHATTYYHYILKHESCIDFIFRGEADLSFPKFVEKIDGGNRDFSGIGGLAYVDKKGKIVHNEMERIDNLDAIKIPDYKEMNLQKYILDGYRFSASHPRNAPIWITRGCPYRCQFCSASILNGKRVRKHSVEYSMKWIRYLRDVEKIKHINIIDDNFTLDLEYAKEFCKTIISSDLGVTMGTPNGIRMQRLDDELCELMKRAGWNTIIVAPESGSVSTLERMKKDIDPKVVPPIVKMIKKHGLKVQGFFIIGYPGDTKKDLELTLELLRKCDFDFFFLNNFQPIPGTPVFDELLAKGEIPPDLLPKNYSDGERAYTDEGLTEINFPRIILMEYLRLYLRKPGKLFYALKIFPPKLLVKKVLKNFQNA